MRQTSVAIESAKGVNMHAIRPACTIFAIWFFRSVRQVPALREVGEWGALVMMRGNECWKREWWIQEKPGGEEAGPDGFNLCSRTRPSALNVKD
jgi:hypothetical protein